MCSLYAYYEHPHGDVLTPFGSPVSRGTETSPATLGTKRRFRSENGERKLAEMTIFADRCCPCGEVKAKKEYQEGSPFLSAPLGARLAYYAFLLHNVTQASQSAERRIMND